MSIYSQTFLYLYRLLLFLPQKTGMRENISIIGRGIGQVMFQNNALSGIIMLIGIICNSWQLAILAVAGTVVGTIAASLLNYDKEDIRAGLYGFNGTLVGIAIGVFMEINIISVALLVIGAAISSWVSPAKFITGIHSPVHSCRMAFTHNMPLSISRYTTTLSL